MNPVKLPRNTSKLCPQLMKFSNLTHVTKFAKLRRINKPQKSSQPESHDIAEHHTKQKLELWSSKIYIRSSKRTIN